MQSNYFRTLKKITVDIDTLSPASKALRSPSLTLPTTEISAIANLVVTCQALAAPNLPMAYSSYVRSINLSGPRNRLGERYSS